MKKVIQYCVVAFKLSPKLFVLSCAYVLLLSFAKFGVTYSFKFISNYIVLPSGKIYIVIGAFIVLFICNLISGYNSNLTELLNLLSVKNFRQYIYGNFMKQAYKCKQDLFYNSNFYNNYEFVKEHIDDVVEICVTIFNKLFSSIITIIISIIAITVFNPLMFVIMLACSAFMVFINRYAVKEKINLNNSIIPEERKAAYFFELMSSRLQAKEIRVFELNNVFWKKWNTSYNRYMIDKYKLDQKVLILTKMPAILQQVLSGILTIYFLYLVEQGKMSVGDFTFLFGMMMVLMQEMNNLIDIFSKDIAEKIEYINAYDCYVGKNRDQEDNLHNYVDNEFGSEKFEVLTIKDLSYSYPNQTNFAIDNLSISIKKGEVVCLLGYNGSGKSTLSKIICGLLEDYKGSVYINGYNLRDIKQEYVFRKFGIGFQDYTRYSISLKENIQVGMIEDCSYESLQKAKDKANIKELIQNLPQGEDTILGKEYDSDGQDLSGGQWQKVILARAYMGEPDFLILDEPTAAIDPIEEMKVLGDFRKVIMNKTALLVSHRIGFAKMADRILFMQNGKIIENGSHSELLKQKGEYYRIYQAQKELYEK